MASSSPHDSILTAPGGPAAVYGFLFQILRAAELALTIDLHAPDRNVSNVTLIAEPRSGGDLQVVSSQTRLVIQFKTRAKGTWSLTDVVDKVLPDLYRGVAEEGVQTTYRFVTNGRMGQWAAAQEFFRSLSARETDGRIFDRLDGTERRFRFRGKLYSERDLFEQIADSLRRIQPGKSESTDVVRRKLWQLLSRFEFIHTGDAADAERRVRTLLSDYVVDDETLDDKVGRLVIEVLKYTTERDRRFTREQLLQDAGVQGIAFTKLPSVRAAVHELTIADFLRLTGYERTLSARALASSTERPRIQVFSGESGQGKSWRLGDFAHELMESDRHTIVVVVRATGDFRSDIASGMQRVLRDGLGQNTSSANPEQIAKKVRDSLSELSDSWLTVCLDDVQSSSEILDLCDAPLAEWGIRVVLTTLPRYARHAAFSRAQAVIERVRDFSDSELREFLSRRERNWATIPSDVRNVIRRPLLAELVVREATEWSPKTEYDLYNACWKRLATERQQPEHPDDVGVLLDLADDFLKGGHYPWPRVKLRDIGITGDRLLRLEAIGWLREEEDGAARIWHDRLLNWAVAERVAQSVRQLASDTTAIAEVLMPFFDERPAETAERPHLAYVPMDVLWMCATRLLIPTASLAAVIALIEGERFDETRVRYRMLASIGPAIVPALAERLRLAEGEENFSTVESDVQRAILDALRHDKKAAPAHVLRLLDEPFVPLQRIGVRAAAEHPSGAYASRIWTLLKEHDGEDVDSTTQEPWNSAQLWERDRLLRALTAAVGVNRNWLEQEIRSLKEPDVHAATLAWILSSFGDPEGRDLWYRVKDELHTATPDKKPGGLIACIRTFRDSSEVPRLEAWLESPHDFAASSALSALALVAPDKALAFVKAHDSQWVSTFASWWMPWLMLVRQEEVRAAARERLSKDIWAPQWFAHREQELDGGTAEAIIHQLSEDLDRFLEGPPQPGRPSFEIAAQLLRDASHAQVVDVLQRYENTEFERRLIEAARRLPVENTSTPWDVSRHIRVLLRRVSERAGVEAVRTELLSETEIPDREIDWAIAYPVPEVRDELRAYVDRAAATWDKKWIPPDVMRCVRALAVIGDDQAVIEAIWTFGPNVVGDDVPWLIADHKPMSDKLVESLLAALHSADADDRARALGGLRISRRRDLLPIILQTAAGSPATAAVQYHGLRAARDLIEPGTEVVGFLGEILDKDLTDSRWILADLLFRSGTLESLEMATEQARRLPFTHVADQTVVERLVDHSDRGREMAKLVEKQMPPFPHAWMMMRDSGSTWVKLFPVIATEEHRQKALDFALSESHSIDSFALIRCVATFDIDAAFDLTMTAIEGDRKGREVLPPYLFELDPRRATESLLRHLPNERVAAVRWSIGRVLRWADGSELASGMREMQSSSDARVREAAYDCAGWRGDSFSGEELRETALTDVSPIVRTAALDALARRVRLTEVGELLERLENSDGSMSWMYAEAVVIHGDPHLLSRKCDPLCVWPILKKKPRALGDKVAEWLNERSDEIAREASSEDFVRGRDDR